MTLEALGGRPIVCCEQAKGRILILNADADWSSDDAILWSWCAAQSPGIAPEHAANWFGYPSDAKPVLEATHLLTVASHGGVALVRLADSKVIFYAFVGGNPHSAALLPDGDIVTASSEGGYLRLFRTEAKISQCPDRVVFTDLQFEDAHGLLWDSQRERLWALGARELKRFCYSDKCLEEEAAFPLPMPADGNNGRPPGGHDLAPDPSSRSLFVTTTRGVYLFDPVTGDFSDFAPLAGMRGVKSISRWGNDIIMMRAKQEWWSDTIQHVGQDCSRTLPGARFYKARWWMDASARGR